MGELGKSGTAFTEAHDLFSAAGDKRGAATATHLTGDILYDHGNYAEANSTYESALAIFREIGDQRDASRSLNNLGNVANDIGDFPKAMRYYEQTLAIDREMGSKSGMAGALGNMANVFDSMGDLPNARKKNEEGHPDVWKAGIPAIADTRFAFTQYSFNQIVASTQARALKVVEGAGGKVTATEIEIPVQEPEAPPLEQWDSGAPLKRVEVNDPAWTFKGQFNDKSFKHPWGGEVHFKETAAAGAEATLAFEGTGVAVVGICTQEGGRADVFLDGEKVGEIDAWIPKNTTDDDYWHVSGLRAGKHSVRIVVRADNDARSKGAKLQIKRAVVYGTATPS